MPADTRLTRLLHTPWFLWLLLALPGLVLTYRYTTGATFYGEYVHATGELGVRLLMLAMAVTPLRLLFPGAAWVGWLMRRRRCVGVAAFGYALLHAIAYLERQAALPAIVEDALEVAMLTGWIALLLMSVLAATSNDVSVRRLRGSWKWLHRTVYVAAALTFAHWILSAFDPAAAYFHLAVLGTLEAVRLVLAYRARVSGSR